MPFLTDYLKVEEIIKFFQCIHFFQPHFSIGIYLASSRNEYQEIFMGIKTRPPHEIDNLIAICKQTI
jgi:hypothetical protein